MSEPGAEGWGRALDEVGQAVAACLAALDRYEAAFAEVLVPPSASGAGRGRLGEIYNSFHDRGARADGGWDGRLSEARARADAAERVLAEQEAAWAGWQKGVMSVGTGIEQRGGAAGRAEPAPATAAEGAGDGEGRGDPAGRRPVDPVRRAA